MGSFALLMPIHLAIHLSTSPTVTSRKADDFAVKAPQLLSIPLSFVIGFLVPAVALALPAPSILSYSQKQSWIAAWQVFPIWMEISQQILSFVIPKLSSSSSTKRQSQRYSSLDTIRALRVVYVFALVVVGVTHITTFAISITSKLFPAIFTPEFRGVLDPTKVSLPASPFPLKKITSLGKGAFQLLQYDEICGSAALLVWSAALLVKKYNEIQCFGFGAALKMLAATVGLTVSIPNPRILVCYSLSRLGVCLEIHLFRRCISMIRACLGTVLLTLSRFVVAFWPLRLRNSVDMGTRRAGVRSEDY